MMQPRKRVDRAKRKDHRGKRDGKNGMGTEERVKVPVKAAQPGVLRSARKRRVLAI